MNDPEETAETKRLKNIVQIADGSEPSREEEGALNRLALMLVLKPLMDRLAAGTDEMSQRYRAAKERHSKASKDILDGFAAMVNTIEDANPNASGVKIARDFIVEMLVLTAEESASVGERQAAQAEARIATYMGKVN